MKGGAGGFYTEEIRRAGTREGFRLVTLDGETAILAHTSIRSPYRVSKYGVDTDALERIGVPALYRAERECDLVIIDEIGKMELFSAIFREAVLRIVDGGKRVLGTIMLNPHPWADALKGRPEVDVITVTRDNYQSVRAKLWRWLEAIESLKA